MVKHSNDSQTGNRRVLRLARGLCLYRDFSAAVRIFHVHARRLFRTPRSDAGVVFPVASMAVFVPGAGGGDATLVGGTAAWHDGIVADDAGDSMAGDCG